MKIAFNPSTVAALTTPPNNKDITFDLRGRNIFARGVKFYGTDTNTWRDIKINNVSIGSNTLDLRNGSNTTLTNTNGIVTINSTWRPVVDNLTSDSTTSSLSAKQGKVLKALIDGKSNSDHNHDGRYVKKSGDTMSGVLTIDTTNFGALTIKRNDDANDASIQFRGKSSVYGYIGLNNSTKDKQFLRWSSDTSRIYTILDTSSTYISNGKGVINGTTITQVDNATNSTNSTNADMVDGEHASSFVRAGHYESNDLNKLDTYSFIRSVNSNVSSTSPKGNTGWYNVIQLVHRNGASDGPGYIGQIALGMTTNTNDMFFRGKRTDPWKTVIHSGNYTEFINNYYWANVKISTSSSTTTSPTVSNLTATSSIRMGNISLEYTKEINNITNGSIYLNYRNSGDVSLCCGGGNVGIGTTTCSYKLDVNGQMRASGFHHSSKNSDNYILLAGGGYKSFGGDSSTPIFLGYLRLYNGNDGTISGSFPCLGYSVPFTYTRGGAYCLIKIPDTTHQSFYIKAAVASVHYSGTGMGQQVGNHSGDGSWWLYCDAVSTNAVQVQGFHPANEHNDSWWGGNPLYSSAGAAKIITVCLFGHVLFR